MGNYCYESKCMVKCNFETLANIATTKLTQYTAMSPINSLTGNVPK